VIGQVLTVKEIVTTLAHGLSRNVEYQAVPDRFWAETAGTRINAHAVAHLSKLWASFRARRPGNTDFAVTDTIGKLGGRKPKTFAEFVVEEKLSFPSPAGG
jgi:hypothetical protein